jgi:Ca-activated chloride channel family protein
MNKLKKTTVRISGIVGGKKISYLKSIPPRAISAKNKAIRYVWARNKIAEMQINQIMNPSESRRQEITDFSIENSVLCKYTAFIAVDSSRKTEGSHGYAVNVPVNVPYGVKYETTVK